MADEQQLLTLIADRREAILAGVTRDGYPHLTNVLYIWDAEQRVARISTTSDRVKSRILRRDRRAALHVPGPHFYAYAVAEGDADLTDPAREPGDEACRELLRVHSSFYGQIEDEAAFFGQMIDAGRLVVRLHVRRVYGVIHDPPSGS